MFKKIAIFISLISITYQQCIPTQEALTYGERYINPESTCEYMFSFVSKNPCETSKLNFYLFKPTGEQKKVILKSSKDYTFKDPSVGGGMDYKGSSYFYCIDREDVVKFISSKNELNLKIVADDKTYDFKYIRREDLGDFQSKKISKDDSQEYDTQLKLFWIADMDISANSTYTRGVMDKTNWSNFDALIHTGDFAYDIDDQNGKRGDDYFQTLNQINTKVPYLVTPGNHENYDKTRLFNYRFRMTNSDVKYEDHSNNYYTLKLRNTQFFFINYDYFMSIDQDSWKKYFDMVEADLIESKNDKNIIWRVVLTHRPVYCSDNQMHDCLTNPFYLISFQSLYRKYGVQFHLNGHEHMYERPQFMSLDFKIKHYNMMGERVQSSNLKKRIIQKDGMKASYKGQIPYHHKFDGDTVHVTNGCAGTTEFFLDEISDYPLNSILVTGTQCYSTIEVTDKTFRIQVFNSKNPDIILDDLTVHLDDLPTQKFKLISDFKWTIAKVLLLFLIVAAGTGIFMALTRILVDKSTSKKGEYMMAEINRTKRIESGQDDPMLMVDDEPMDNNPSTFDSAI